MNLNYDVLDNTEKLIYAFRSLYNDYGYTRYKMRKFEEYDLYSRNKDFLVSESVITFMDTSGKLMALKPDVTLSIIKNNKEIDGLKKLCYNENVYRISSRTKAFREIMQTGLECLGDVDYYCIGEVLLLAVRSLALVNSSFVLEITDLDILSAFINNICDDTDMRNTLIKAISEKNLHEIESLCSSWKIEEDKTQALIRLLTTYGPASQVLDELRSFPEYDSISDAVEALAQSLAIFERTAFKDNIQIDFSLCGDMKYYNGIIFNGFIDGIPESVLSGGQYDKLMKKMGRDYKAIGFAVYMDLLDRVNEL